MSILLYKFVCKFDESRSQAAVASFTYLNDYLLKSTFRHVQIREFGRIATVRARVFINHVYGRCIWDNLVIIYVE